MKLRGVVKYSIIIRIIKDVKKLCDERGSEMVNNKEKYYETINILTEEGLLREVFVDENISILNIADKVYMVNVIDNKKKRKKAEQYVTGYMADSEMIDYVSNGYEHYYKMLKAQGSKIQLMKLDPQTIAKIRKFKSETSKKGPGKNINYETEERLKYKMNHKDSLEKKGFLEKIVSVFK